MACTKECTAPTPAQAHCGVCHVTFSGVFAFDAHRDNGRCLDPRRTRVHSAGMKRKLVQDSKGIWRADVPNTAFDGG